MKAPSAFVMLIQLLLFFFFPHQSLSLSFGRGRFIVPDPSPESFAPVGAPAPASGGDLPKLPSEGGVASSPVEYSNDPFQPVSGPALSEAPSPESGGAIPFISSNPAVPLPAGITDTATILPLPSPGGYALAVGHGSQIQIQLMWAVFVIIFSFWASDV